MNGFEQYKNIMKNSFENELKEDNNVIDTAIVWDEEADPTYIIADYDGVSIIGGSDKSDGAIRICKQGAINLSKKIIELALLLPDT